MNPTKAAMPSLLLLCLWVTPSVAAVNSQVQFVQDQASCPAGDLQALIVEGSVRQVIGTQDKRSCMVECSLWQQCVVVHHSPATVTCRLGNLKAWLQAWQAAGTDDCISYIRPPPMPADLQAKLLMFYNFRFGLANQPNASAFSVTLGTVQRSKLGLQLFGNFTSNAEVDMMGRGISQYVDSATRQITFYTKVTAKYDYENRCFHATYNKSIGAYDSLSGKWCRGNFGSGVTFLARRLIPVSYTSVAILPSDTTTPVTYSTAVSFSSSPAASARFFYNGSIDQGTPIGISDSGGPLADDGLAIGFDIYSPFKGLVHCYGVAKAALTEDEVKLLDGLC